MRDELKKKLFKEYPKIFAQNELSSKETEMYLEIECDDGWYTLIDQLCYKLQFDTDHNNLPQVKAVQVKEKWGGLRFYTDGHNDEQNGAITLAEQMSYYICETCGSMNDVQQTKTTWIKSLCKTCRDKK